MSAYDTVAASILLGLGVLSNVFLLATLIRLIRRHAALYEQLMQSSFLPVLGIPGSWTMLKFIGLRKHRGSGDKTLSALSDSTLVTLALCVIVVIVIANDQRLPG